MASRTRRQCLYENISMKFLSSILLVLTAPVTVTSHVFLTDGSLVSMPVNSAAASGGSAATAARADAFDQARPHRQTQTTFSARRTCWGCRRLEESGLC